MLHSVNDLTDGRLRLDSLDADVDADASVSVNVNANANANANATSTATIHVQDSKRQRDELLSECSR